MALELKAGNLKIEICEELKSKVDTILRDARETGSMREAVKKAGETRKFPYPLGGGSKHLLILYTDLEPDDILACAQLLAWKAELNELGTEPIFIFVVNLHGKDGGTILEKKQLMASLALGDVNWHILTFEGDTGDARSKIDGTVHLRTEALADARNAELDAICDKLAKFDGTHIDFYPMAPGHGNIGAILERLVKRDQWPLRPKWQLSMYSGSFNTRGMTESDMQALGQIMKCSDGPLVDMSSFIFFGGKASHRNTVSLAWFSLPDFVPQLLECQPLYAAAWRTFNDEFNVHLIHPDNRSLFKGETLTLDESGRLAALKRVFTDDGVNAFALALRSDEGLFSKVAGYKQSTVEAFAANACDSPICDQLLFLNEWLLKNNPSAIEGTTPGKWCMDRNTGFTKVAAEDGEGIPGIQPFLKEPQDNALITELQKAAEAYVFRHLGRLQSQMEALFSALHEKNASGAWEKEDLLHLLQDIDPAFWDEHRLGLLSETLSDLVQVRDWLSAP